MNLKRFWKRIGNYQRNVILNYFFKIVSLLLGLIIVKINIKYLGANLYGLWVTIASIVSWMSSGDFGIGNGLRNKLAEAYAKGDVEDQYKYIVTAIKILSKISVILFGIIFVVCEVLFRTSILDSTIRIPMYITSAFFCLNLITGTSQSIAYSFQKSCLTSIVNCLTQALSVLLVFGLIIFCVPKSLILFSIVNGICTILPNIVLMFFLNRKYLDFIGRIENGYDPSKIRDITNIGLQFFGLQLCSIILFSTDNVIINNLFGSNQVTKYSIISKIYDTGAGMFSVLLTALWSAVTLKITQNDVLWINKKIKRLLALWGLFCLGVLFVSMNINVIVRYWLGEESMRFDNLIVGVFGVYCVVTTGYGIFVNILNGMGKVRLQLFLAIIESIINIPLSVFLGKSIGMGIVGVKLATLLCVCVSAVILPIHTLKILSDKRVEKLNDASIRN